MANTADTKTIILRGVTYIFTPEIDEDDDDTTPARQLGWLTGPRGATAMVVKTQPVGTYLVHAGRNGRLEKLPTAEVHAAFTALFAA
jgi:hypothetical protein